MTRPFRVVIAGDHALFRQGLRSMLQLYDDVRVVQEVGRAEELAGALATIRCDILLLDLQMDPNALRDIGGIDRRVQIVVVTANEWPESAQEALRLGARAVVLKRFAVETLMDAIRSVAQGRIWLPPELRSAIGTE